MHNIEMISKSIILCRLHHVILFFFHLFLHVNTSQSAAKIDGCEAYISYMWVFFQRGDGT